MTRIVVHWVKPLSTMPASCTGTGSSPGFSVSFLNLYFHLKDRVTRHRETDLPPTGLHPRWLQQLEPGVIFGSPMWAIPSRMLHFRSSTLLTQLNGKEEDGQMFGSLPPCGRSGWGSRLLTLVWCSPGYCSQLESEPVDGRSLSFLFSL